MTNSLNQLFDFFLPRFCAGCERRLDVSEEVICPECLQSIKIAEKRRIEDEFDRNFRESGYISDFTSLYVFEKDKTLQQVIHQLKYAKKFLIGKYLGKKVAQELKDIFTKWKIDLIVPVPLHHLKIAERGYNQSDYIGKGISKITGIDFDRRLLKRKRFTESQTLLNQIERELNMADAFKLRNTKKVNEKVILLIDDIITTGSTMRECAKVLIEGGAKQVYACSVAVAD